MRIATALAALLLPALAGAGDGPTLAARVAFAPAVGSLAASLPMSEGLQAQLPAQLDALWRFGPFSAGAYTSVGLGLVGAAACADGADCSGSAVRVGVQGIRDFGARGPGWPAAWAGAGLGWEWARWSRERLGSETSWSYGGPEALVQGGAEWRSRRFALGPYALVGVGRYTSVSLDTGVSSASADVGERAFHAWIHLGVRWRVDL